MQLHAIAQLSSIGIEREPKSNGSLIDHMYKSHLTMATLSRRVMGLTKGLPCSGSVARFGVNSPFGGKMTFMWEFFSDPYVVNGEILAKYPLSTWGI
jgi:hypothetical protein